MVATAVCLISVGSSFSGSYTTRKDVTARIEGADIHSGPMRLSQNRRPPESESNPAKMILRSPTTNSPGRLIGNTYIEFQCDGSMGRRIATGHPQNEYTHMVWVYQANPLYWDPQCGIWYQVYHNGGYDLPAGGIDIAFHMYEIDASLAVLPDNRSVVGYTYIEPAPGSYFGSNVNVEIEPNLSIFSYYELMPDPDAEWYHAGASTVMPSVEVHYGTDTVIYAFTSYLIVPDEYRGQVLYRKVGDGDFDNGRFLDANYGFFQTIVARQNTDSVAVVYIDKNWAGGGENSARLNTVYRLSTNQGITWGPVVNVSNYSLDSLWLSDTEVSALWDDNGDLHIAWHAREKDAESGLWWRYRCRIFHWSTADQLISVVAEARYSAECFSNDWDWNAGRLSLSQCEDKLYVSWAQFNDYDVPDDCSEGGFANGEIYMAASDDNGLTWDTAVNLTNTRTPGCAPGDCESDVYPSMVRYGVEYEGVRDTLDIIYINDKDAGVAFAGEGVWTVNNVMHYRIPCRDVVHLPRITLEPSKFEYPMMMEPDQTVDTSFTIVNIGNGVLNWEAAVHYATGEKYDWLTASPLSGTVDRMPNNTGSVTMMLNSQNLPGDPSVWEADVIISAIDYPVVVDPDTVHITLIVASDNLQPKADTINNGCRSLIAYNTGQTGGNHHGYSLDIPGDCDTIDAYPEADMYLYDASPVIAYVDDTGDTVAYTAIFQQIFTDSATFRPLTGFTKTSETDFDLIQYTAMTTDSVFGIDVTFIVPTDGSCFIFGRYDYHLMDGVTEKTGVCLGMIADWDIPSDTAADNGSGCDVTKNSIWQYGAEYHADNQGVCNISETNRLGGLALLSAPLRNAWTADNQAHQEPPAYDPKFLYSQMSSLTEIDLYTPGYGQPAFIDLHTGMTFSRTDMTPNDTFTYLVCLVTTNEGETDYQSQVVAAEAWANAHVLPADCLPGDANNDLQINIGDAVHIINYIFKGGPPPAPYGICSGDPNGDCVCNIGDAVYLINYIFKGGPAPVSYFEWYTACGSPRK